MNDWLPIFRRARKSLVVLLTILAVSLGLYFGSAYSRGQLTADLAQQQAQISSEQENLAQKQKELDSIQANIQKFRQLQQQGMIGKAKREEWIEQLIATRKQLGLPETLTYTLKQPASLSANPNPEQTPADSTQAVASDAPLAHNLEFELRHIHEEELLAFLKTYQSKVNGRFRIQSCRLAEPATNGLLAQCTLRFFTLPQKPAGQT